MGCKCIQLPKRPAGEGPHTIEKLHTPQGTEETSRETELVRGNENVFAKARSLRGARKGSIQQPAGANRQGKKMTLRTHVKNRKKILQFNTVVVKLHDERLRLQKFYRMRLETQRSQEKILFVGLRIFDYFDLRELIFIG